MSLERISACIMVCSLLGTACETQQESFVDDRERDTCDESYVVCNMPAGCVLDKQHFVEGFFPGAGRIVIVTEENNVTLNVYMLFSKMNASGSEFIIRAYEPDCTLDTHISQEHLVDVDIFDYAGNDQSMIFELEALNKGEHLIEVYSDASAEYTLLVEQR